MSTFLRALAPILGELTNDGRSRPRYTWAAKGWGGARRVNGEALGYDCSGFACGLLWRVGRLPVRRWTNTDGLWAMGRPVTVPEPLDLVLFGDNDPPGDMSHVGVVVAPGHYLDFGGGGSRTQPGGSDWPPERGYGPRLLALGTRADQQGFRRVSERWTGEDLAAVRAWAGHVQAHRRGEAAPLSQELQGPPFFLRPMSSGY